MLEKNNFSGENGLFDYLNPRNGQYTPMVELPRKLNPYIEYNVHLHMKLLSALPLANVKSIPAFHMLEKSRQNPDNHDKTHVIESSSGNTAASLGVLAAYFGYQDVQAYVSHEVSRGKLQMLQLFGVTPVVNKEPICPSENDTASGIHKARARGRTKGWLNPDQYANPDNIEAHYKVTGPQIWEQRQGRVDYFCAGLGTTGTMLGAARYLKERNNDIGLIGVVRAPNNPVPGPRTKHLLEDVAFDWQSGCDELVEIGTLQSYELSLQMIRMGLLAGPSSGMNLAGAYRFIEEKISSGEFTVGQDAVHIVVPCCDTPFPYMDEYFAVLPAQAFPAIENAGLLLHEAYKSALQPVSEKGVTSAELFDALQGNDPRIKVIDVRPVHQYAHFHIPGSINIPEDDFITKAGAFADLYKDDRLYFVCNYGNRSGGITQYARSKNLDAVNLDGGLIEWCEQDYPRVKDENCVLRYGLNSDPAFHQMMDKRNADQYGKESIAHRADA